MNRRLKILSVPLLILVAAGIGFARWSTSGDDGRRTATVQREDFRVTVQCSGKLEAAVAFEVGPPSAQDYWNYDLTWMIPEGTRVEQGAVVARFDTTQLDDRLRTFRADLETTLQQREKEQRNLEISLRQLRLDLVKAEGELQMVDLDLSVPESLISDIEIEQTRLRKNLAVRRVAFLREKIEFEKSLVRSKLELLEVKQRFAEDKISSFEATKGKFSVQAPVAGLVIYIPKRNGDRWEVGESVWMLAKLLKVADVSTLRVEADVLEVDASKIAPGQAATITIDAGPGMTLDSTISEIGQIVHERSQQDPSKVFSALIPLPEFDAEQLRPGMGVQVEIETRVLADRLTVPVEAIGVGPEGPFVSIASERSGRRPVELGERNGDRVVVESGLEEGQVVRLSPGSAS